MIELIGVQDFVKIMEGGMTHELTPEMFEAWGVDPEALSMFISRMVLQAMRQVFESGKPTLAFYTAHMIGFEVGYKCALEVEQRRIANEQT